VPSLIFGVLSLGRAALDQATSYQKLLMAATFMHYVLVRYEDQLKGGSIKLEDVVKFIEAWSKRRVRVHQYQVWKRKITEPSNRDRSKGCFVAEQGATTSNRRRKAVPLSTSWMRKRSQSRSR
jgi:hypothetical protein